MNYINNLQWKLINTELTSSGQWPPSRAAETIFVELISRYHCEAALKPY